MQYPPQLRRSIRKVVSACFSFSAKISSARVSTFFNVIQTVNQRINEVANR